MKKNTKTAYVLSILAILLGFSSINFAASAVSSKIEIRAEQNPAVLNIKESPFKADWVRIRFEDYVSNPKPNRADPSQGVIANYDSPFFGLVKPSSLYTSLKPLPESAGLSLGSFNGTVSFYDSTNTTVCCDVKVDPALILRFIDPDNINQAAAVSSIALSLTGTSIRDKNAKISIYDIEDNCLFKGTIPSGSKENGLRTDMQYTALDRGKETPAIHKVIIENDGQGYLVLGTIKKENETDFAYTGFKTIPSSKTNFDQETPITHCQQWKDASKAITISDLSKCFPKEFLSDHRKKGKWKVIDYETFNFSGNALVTGPEAEAKPVKFSLDLSGWHAVYIGLSTIRDIVRPSDNMIRAKLTKDSSYTRLSNRLKLGALRRDMIEEVFMRADDLTGQDIEFAGVPHKPGVIMYVKCVPLTEQEVEEIQQDTAQRETKTMVATFDNHHWIWPFHPETESDLEEMFSSFKGSDFGIWWFQTLGADLVNYKTSVGSIPGENLDVFPRPADKDYTESILKLIDKGINPLQVAVNAAHKQNAQIILCIRPAGWKCNHPFEDYFTTKFYEEHPEWRCIDYDGTPTMYMSYAVEQVQDQVIAILREALETGADGAGVLFHRGLPTILWEEPFCQRFLKKYGEDPRKLSENDPRVAKLRGEIMTEFIGKIRDLLDEIQKKHGRKERMALAVSTFATEKDNLKYGLDVERWINKKLIDQVGVAWFAYHTSLKNPADMEYYARITKNSDVKFYPFFVGWKLDGAQKIVKMTKKYYEQGADGIAVWDPIPTNGWTGGEEGNSWPVLSRLGHRDENPNRFKVNRIPLKRFGENHFSRWFPSTGF